MNAQARVEDTFDFQNPDYLSVFRARAERLQRIREIPALAIWAKAHYREHLDDFISDWGCIQETRNIEIGRPAFIPFVLFQKQREFVRWSMDRWRAREDALCEKSRDSGATWLAVAISCSLCMLFDGLTIGFGSRKAEYVDKKGAPKSIFDKIRNYMRAMPKCFSGGWDENKNSREMVITFPGTSSTIVGEAGDDIGRGDRTGIYWVDEAAHLEHPEDADRALSQTTNCRIDISTPLGMANSFAIKRHAGKLKVFTFHWRDDPRKSEAWYAKQIEKYDPVTVAQEIDISYTASVEGLIISPAWWQSCIDADKKIPGMPSASGARLGALDVADEGRDSNAMAIRHGNYLLGIEEWSGKESDLFATAERMFQVADQHRLENCRYDADGLGAAIRGDSERIRARRDADRLLMNFDITAFRGSGAVLEPARIVPGTDVLAKDRWQNAKAEGWGSLSERVRNTHRAVQWHTQHPGMAFGSGDYDADNLLVVRGDIAKLAKLSIEVSTPQWKISATGKLLVDKVPDGAASPNLADAVMMVFAPRQAVIDWAAIRIDDEMTV